MCNDLPLLVTPTAFEMLKCLQPFERPFWIDAICINQENSAEKAVQIPLMQRIFAHAGHVLIWLGTSKPSVVRFMVNFPNLMDLAARWTPKTYTHDPSWRGQDWPQDNDMLWTGLYLILVHNWFWRLWTFQEIVLAKRALMICGSVCIDAVDFLTFVQAGFFSNTRASYLPYDAKIASCVIANPTPSYFAFGACNAILRSRQKLHESGVALDLARLSRALYNFQWMYVQEPVDRIWAIAGLLRVEILRELVPSVDHSVQGRKEYWKTYLAFAKVVFCAGQTLQLLTMSALQNGDVHLPSWCPDFSKKSACWFHLDGSWNEPLNAKGHVARPLHCDGHDEERSSMRSAMFENHTLRHVSVGEDNVLRTRGFILDTISEIVDYPPLARQDKPPFLEDTWLWARSDKMLSISKDFHSRSLALAQRTLESSQGDEERIPPEYLMAIFADCRIADTAERSYRDVWTCLSTGGYTSLESLEENWRHVVWSCLQIIQHLQLHTFFATEKGRFGIATPGVKPGDQVCAFYGGEPLHILRRVDMKSESYTFCGIAFIAYLMEQQERDAARLGPDTIFNIG